MSTIEQINGKTDEVIEMTSLDTFKKVQNLEQWILSLEGKIDKLTDLIDKMRGAN